MSPEVATGTYLYEKRSPFSVEEPVDTTAPRKNFKKLLRRSTDVGADPSSSETSDNDADTSTSKLFRNNPLHDSQSVLWVCLWILLCSDYVKSDESMTQEEWDDYVEAQGRLATNYSTTLRSGSW